MIEIRPDRVNKCCKRHLVFCSPSISHHHKRRLRGSLDLENPSGSLAVRVVSRCSITNRTNFTPYSLISSSDSMALLISKSSSSFVASLCREYVCVGWHIMRVCHVREYTSEWPSEKWEKVQNTELERERKREKQKERGRETNENRVAHYAYISSVRLVVSRCTIEAFLFFFIRRFPISRGNRFNNCWYHRLHSGTLQFTLDDQRKWITSAVIFHRPS